MEVFIIAVITADGFIAESADQISTAWSSGADKKNFVKLTKEAGVMVMGSKTFETIGRPLPGRTTIVYSRKNRKYDGVEITNKKPEALIKDLKERGFKKVAICGGSSIYTLFMKRGLVDTLYLTVEPIFFGQGLPLFDSKLKNKLSLELVGKLSSSVLLLKYKVYGRSY